MRKPVEISTVEFGTEPLHVLLESILLRLVEEQLQTDNDDFETPAKRGELGDDPGGF